MPVKGKGKCNEVLTLAPSLLKLFNYNLTIWREFIRIIVLLFLLSPLVSFGRDMTKPPSIAMRSEISYVSVVKLTNIEYSEKAVLKFILINDIYNKSSKKFNVSVLSRVARKLVVGSEYIVAYNTLKKVRVNENKKYLPIAGGPTLLKIQGAEPAILKKSNLIITQLGYDPNLAKESPEILLENIFKGIMSKDPAIKEFFIREIVNWGRLHQFLEKSHFKIMKKILTSPNTTTGSLIALFEPRVHLHKSIGIKQLGAKALAILEGMPTGFNFESTEPTLVLYALKFIESNNLGNWEIYEKWTRSNIPSLSERALLKLASINAKKALALAKRRLLDTMLEDTTRRVMLRFVSRFEK